MNILRVIGLSVSTICLLMVGYGAQAVTCTGGTLPPGSGEDLEVTGACTVAGSAQDYHYRNVNIYAGGSLTFDDAKINFWARSILVENDGSLMAGTPDAPIGTKGGIVTLHLYGADQGAHPFGTNPGQGGKGIACKTDIRCGVPETIWNSNGADKVDLPGGVKDYFYAYHTMPYDDGDPNAYFGYKVLAVSYGGTLKLFGNKGATEGTMNSSNSGTSWVRLNKTLLPNQNTLVLDRPVDWQAGDQIVVTTTDYLPGHSEQFTIKSIAADGTITVDKTAQYIHNGEVFPLDHVPGRLNLDIKVNGQAAAETRAAVALLTRSIRIVSAGDEFGQPFPDGIGKYFGGHSMVRQGAKTYQVQGVEFFQMGQGGRLGHYPVHFHMTRKTPTDTFVKDSSIHDSMTRWIVLHGAHDVTLARNVGYKSIGHGYYLEDGTEINNKLHSNIGILARAAVDNVQNPRQVPGILASPPELTPVVPQPDFRQVDLVPYHSDYDHPSVFWIMNGWNEFEYNMAAGAGTCGACYWLVPGANSGPSRDQKWESYASMQKGLERAATTPLKSFRGNYCSSAMNSFNTVSNTTACNGVDIPINPNGQALFDVLKHIDNPLAPARLLDLGNPPIAPKQNPVADDYYPLVDPGGGRFATRCDGDQADCSTVQKCANGPGLDNCMVTVLDRYTSSFHWTETNFAAIWLRPQWYLVTNSVLSDVQNGGLTFVTGGDYTNASTIDGHWALARKNVFIGHTQPNNPYASNGGPFNPVTQLRCDTQAGNHCLAKAEGVSFPRSNFGVNQRLFNIYDGPAYEDTNAYLDIEKTLLDDCTPGMGPVHDCPNSAWLYGRVLGVPRDANTDQCYLPNAAIGWKQPNGFYYPPAFHSRNLFFDHVDIRHFVIEPLFQAGTFTTDAVAAEKRYCTRNDAMFSGFTDIDRQTELNDDDGSLTGFVNTISVNEDPFFNAPVEMVECASDGTAKTSPYDYVTTVVYPQRKDPAAWSQDCAGPFCYGVPLYRQLLTQEESLNQVTPSIRMMGMSIYQRNSLTVNNGIYYIDTTVSETTQRNTRASSINVFKAAETYYTFLLYAKSSTRQTYQMYVGQDDNFSLNEDVKLTRATISSSPLVFSPEPWPAIWDKAYDAASGILTVTLDMNMDEFQRPFAAAKQASCKPKSFCAWTGDAETGQCHCSDQLKQDDPKLYAECIQDDHAICGWAGADVDCPEGGCFGFAVTLPASFVADDQQQRPPAQCFPSDEHWDASWNHTDPDLGGACFDSPRPDTKFCDLQAAPQTARKIITGTEGNDRLIGTNGDDIIFGYGGNDRIFGGEGNDWISAGPGDDYVNANGGNDVVHGDHGHDRLIGGSGADVLHGGVGDDYLSGNSGHDVLFGGEGHDDLHGGKDDDVLHGDAGHDELNGNQGHDMLFGNAGNDLIRGHDGHDAIDGGSGTDIIHGGDGLDACVEGEVSATCESAL